MIPIISDVVATPVNALETVEMTMDDSPETILLTMRNMENNYTDSTGATVREYATNALDAHKFAGVTRPIEITVPTAERPFYIVQDFGCGMTRDFLMNNFSKYRFSTKRDDQNVNGMYGIGSKAALSEVNSFSIESISEGYKTFVRIYKTETGSSVSVLAHDKTDEPSGTRVIINVGEYKIEEYREKINDFFYFWDPETVLVDGERPQHVLDDNYQYVEGFGYINNHDTGWYNATLRVLQGNVVYPVNGLTDSQKSKLFGSFPALRRKHVILEVPNGSLAYTDSREGVVNSSDNLAKIGRHITKMFKFMSDNMIEDLNAEKNPWKALCMMDNYVSMFGQDTMKEIEYEHTDLNFKFNPFAVYGWTGSNNRSELRSNAYTHSPEPDFKDILMLVTDSTADENYLRALRALKSYVSTEYKNYPKVYCVMENDFNQYKDNELFTEMVAMKKITLLGNEELAEWHKEYRAKNRAQRTSSSKGVTRDPITYPVKFRNGATQDLTIAELKEQDIKRLFFHHEPKNSHYRSPVVTYGFDNVAIDGDALIHVSSSRNPQVLERRLKGQFEFIPAGDYFAERLRDSYKTYSDVDRIAKALKADNMLGWLIRNLEACEMVEKLDSPFLKGFPTLRENYFAVESNNYNITNCLPWEDRKNYSELLETTSTDAELNAKAFAVMKHYGNLAFMFSRSSLSLGHGEEFEMDYAELVESLNKHYAEKGDPVIA